MNSPMALVRAFHVAFSAPVAATPTLRARTTDRLRLDLILEELCELETALDEEDLIEVADALADLTYVVYGAALTYGIDLDRVIAEVHRSNMTKLGADGRPVMRADGKVLKGPGYEPPRIAAVLGIEGGRN